jgi:hypothetical protein
MFRRIHFACAAVGLFASSLVLAGVFLPWKD